jgi:hypothetical protein
MAGNILLQYIASQDMTVTNLHSLATSASHTAGWTSDAIDNGTNEYEDYLVAANFTTHASNRQIGHIRTYIYANRKDTPTWPDIFTSGTPGTEGAAAVYSAEARDAGLIHVKTIAANATASVVFEIPLFSVASLFGGWVPDQFAFWVTHDVSSTGAGLAAAGSIFTYTPVHRRFT